MDEQSTSTQPDSMVFRVPMSIERGIRKKKTIWLNYNNIHTMHKHEYNTIKKKMTDLMDLLGLQFYYSNYKMHYGIYLPNRAHRDISNVGSIVDKFVCDSMQELGWVPEDDYVHLQHVQYEFMGYDPEHQGYVEVTVTVDPNPKDV